MAHKELKSFHTRIDPELDRQVEEMAEKWRWKKQEVMDFILRSFFKRHKGVPPPPKPPE